MPITISRPVSVYRLWDNDDLRECFEALAVGGWLCSLAAAGSPVVWTVQFQHNTNRLQATATLDDLLVSDGVSVEVQSVDAFNAANPGNEIVRD
jgi:type VI protein secretion system component VasK